jgi:hypothetical protein
MRGVLLCTALAGGALLVPATASARPFTDVASLTPKNAKGQVLQSVRRGRTVSLVVGFRMTNAPRAKGYRVRVSLGLRRQDDRMMVKAGRHPVVYTGAYRYSMPLTVPVRFTKGTYNLLGVVEVLEGKKVVARDTRLRQLRVR